MFGQVFLLSYPKYSLLYNLSSKTMVDYASFISLWNADYLGNQPWVSDDYLSCDVNNVCILVLLYSFCLNTKMQKIFQFCFRRFSDISVLDNVQTTGPLSSPRTVRDRDGSRGRLENLAKDN